MCIRDSHRTTPKPEIYTSITAEKDEAALAIKSYRAPKRTQAAQQQQQKGQYIRTHVYKRTYACIQATRISKNPGSMEEECQYGLPSGACFTARRLEVVAVAGLLWIYFVVWFLVFGGISCVFSFSSLRTHPASAGTRQLCLMYLSTSNEAVFSLQANKPLRNEARPRERINRGRFLPLGQQTFFVPGCVLGAII